MYFPEKFLFVFATLGHPSDVVQCYRAHIDTEHSTDSVPCTHTHVMQCLPCPNAMQLCHCTLCYATCMKTSTWTPYTLHYTMYHGHSCLMYTEVHTFTNVNIHAVILTFITFVSTHQTSMHQHLSDHYLGN